MEPQELTFKRKNEILTDNSETFLERIDTDTMFMAQLVAAKVITAIQSQNIQAMKIPGDMRTALFNLLLSRGVGPFIDFCIVLYDKQNKSDVVEENFGLNIADLRHQTGEIQKKKAEAAMQQRQLAVKKGVQPSTSGTSQVEEQVKELQNVDSTKSDNVGVDMVDVGGASLSEDSGVKSSSVSRLRARPSPTGRGLTDNQGEDSMMVDGPNNDSNTLNPQYQWMGTEFKRLRDSLGDKKRKPVVIALLDSGVNINHPDLQGIVGDSANFIAGPLDEGGNPTEDMAEAMDKTKDSLGHGTFCAGIMAQYAGRNNIRILNAKVLKQDNTCNPSDVLRALKYIDENPQFEVDIVHMAFGFLPDDPEVDVMLAKLGEKKILIAAAGNDGQQRPDTLLSPARHGSVIAVGACERYGKRADFSAVGKGLDFLFPGKGMESTSSASYNTNAICDGTSFAAPVCAALVALGLVCVETQFPIHGSEWRNVLTKSAKMRDLLGEFCTAPTPERGYGIPNLRKVTEEMLKHHLKSNLGAQESDLM